MINSLKFAAIWDSAFNNPLAWTGITVNHARTVLEICDSLGRIFNVDTFVRLVVSRFFYNRELVEFLV